MPPVDAPTPFTALHDIISDGDQPAIYADRDLGKEPLTFSALKAFIDALDLRQYGIGRTDTLCTAMSNGAEAAVCFLAFTAQCVFAPLNPALTVAEIEFELHDLPAHTMIVMDSSREAEVRARQLVVACCERNSVPVLTLLPDPKVAGLFRLDGQTVAAPPAAPTDPGDLALVLHTSGTTKKPKIVPLTHSNLAHGIQYVASTLRRSPHDVCLNVMPLFHIHGLIANVGVSLYARAAVLCSSFQGGAHFVDRLSSDGRGPVPTWCAARLPSGCPPLPAPPHRPCPHPPPLSPPPSRHRVQNHPSPPPPSHAPTPPRRAGTRRCPRCTRPSCSRPRPEAHSCATRSR